MRKIVFLLLIIAVILFWKVSVIVGESSTPTPIQVRGEDYCQLATASKTTLGPAESIDIVSTAKNSDIKSFVFKFFNLENLDNENKPKPIMFTAKTPYEIKKDLTVTTNTQTVTVNFADLDKPDLNWDYYMPRPKKVKIETYFIDISGKLSKYDDKCKVELWVNSVDPTPTPNSSCTCSTAGVCANTCFFDKFTKDITYSNSIKCNLGNDLFRSPPTAIDKTNWCQAYYRTKGDANGDGRANFIDYFYYVGARYGAKLPPTVNVDFNGDGFISSEDRKILIKSLKP